MPWILLLSLIVGVGRFFVPGHDLSPAGSYEAFAHIWVGALLALVWQGCHRRGAAIALAVLTALETVLFLTR